jgi:hypothetical protein
MIVIVREDLIIEEVRLHQEQHATRFNYNLTAIYQNIKEKENESKNTLNLAQEIGQKKYKNNLSRLEL